MPCLVDVEHYVLGSNSSVANDFCETDAVEDVLTIELAIRSLRERNRSTPFYLGVGMHKPHLPWEDDSALIPRGVSGLPRHVRLVEAGRDEERLRAARSVAQLLYHDIFDLVVARVRDLTIR